MKELIAKAAFEAYSNSMGGHTWDHKLIPKWDALPANVKSAWVLSTQMALLMAERFGKLSPEQVAKLQANGCTDKPPIPVAPSPKTDDAMPDTSKGGKK